MMRGDGSKLDQGEQARRAGNYGEALVHFQAHVAEYPDDALGWRLMGDVCWELGDIMAAEAAYSTAVGCPLDNLPGYEQYQPHYRRGLLYQYMGRYRVALKDIEAADVLATDEAWGDRYHYAFFAKVTAELYEALGQLDMAFGEYKRYYQDRTRRRDAHLNAPEVQQLELRLQQSQSFVALGWSGAVLRSELPEPDLPALIAEAVQASVSDFCKPDHLEKLVEQLPADARTWRYLGHSYWYSRGREAEAKKAFARAVELAPQAPESLFIQGCLAYFSGDKPQALRLFNKADAHGLPDYERTHLEQYRRHL